jgi:hypothetical protein
LFNSWKFDLYNELWIESATDLQSIKAKLDWVLAKTKEDKDKLEEKAKAEIDKIVEQNYLEKRNKEEKQKQVLKVLKEIWLSEMIPQTALDQLITLINSRQDLMNFFWLNQKINLQEWILGIEQNGLITYEWRQKLVNILNTAIFWNNDKLAFVLTVQYWLMFSENWKLWIVPASMKDYIKMILWTSPFWTIRMNINSALGNKDKKELKD